MTRLQDPTDREAREALKTLFARLVEDDDNPVLALAVVNGELFRSFLPADDPKLLAQARRLVAHEGSFEKAFAAVGGLLAGLSMMADEFEEEPS